MENADLSVESEQLKNLARDLDAMQEALTKQLLRMDEIVDAIEARWRGPAAEAYRARHRAAAEDAVRIRGTMKLLAEAVRLSEGGFTAQELEVLQQFRRVQAGADMSAEADGLSTPNVTSAVAPRSRVSDL
ncbi:WXG100 family type VII secretion target [Streptomyces sp. NPDC059835]|uniref:WXG100 family type VII secretion target n=1 Tax=Streptomyces sp. NPDC059835 TaxID=3346967 RepID=UPI00365A93A8